MTSLSGFEVFVLKALIWGAVIGACIGIGGILAAAIQIWREKGW